LLSVERELKRGGGKEWGQDKGDRKGKPHNYLPTIFPGIEKKKLSVVS